MIKLYIIKCGEKYLRFSDEKPTLCQLDKASVFPLDDIVRAKRALQSAVECGFINAEPRELHLAEKPVSEDRKDLWVD